MPDYSSTQMLQTALEAAHRAGELLLERLPADHDVSLKGYRDPVTDADTAAEAVILGLIRARFPEHKVLSEEAGGSGISGAYTWVIDPLDGTTNYSRRHPTFSVSIGLLLEGEPVVGVVHDPVRGHTFAAERGRGAWLNGQPAHVSAVSTVREALVGLDWSRADADRRRALACLGQIAPRCHTVRATGSAALAMAYVASGWLDAYFHVALQPWDSAAASLIVIEAGGEVSNFAGERYRVRSPDCLATNGHVHDEMLMLLAAADLGPADE